MISAHFEQSNGSGLGDVSANEAKGTSFMTQAKWPGSACALADACVALREAAEWQISLFRVFGLGQPSPPKTPSWAPPLLAIRNFFIPIY